MESIVDALSDAYQEFVAAAAGVLEAKELSGGEKTPATDAALENFKQRWELFRVACDRAEEFVESVKQQIGSECLVDEATGSVVAKLGEAPSGLPPISAVRLEQMSKAVRWLVLELQHGSAKMAVGKNKRVFKNKNKGKKKVADPFTRKDWYEIKAPAAFAKRIVGKTPVNRTQAGKNANDALIGRSVWVSLADLQGDEDQAFRNVKLKVQDVQGKTVLTNFWGMDFTTDKMRSLIRKWQTLIEAHVDVKTTDGYILRLFALAFTRRRPNQVKKTCYAQTSQVRKIRAKMVEIMTREATTCDLKDLVVKFIPESIGKLMEKECNGIFPLSTVYIRKVKMLKAPKFDPHKLAEIHAGGAAVVPTEEAGTAVDREDGDRPTSSIDAVVVQDEVVGL